MYAENIARTFWRIFRPLVALIAATVTFEAHAGLEGLYVESEKLTLARPATGVSAPDVIGLEIDGAAYRKLEELGSALVEDFPLPGRGAVDLELTAFDVAPNARFVVVDASGERVVPRPDIHSYRGLVAGDVDSLVTLNLFDGRIAGFVRAFGEEFGVGPRDFGLAREGATDIQVWNSELTEEAPETLCDGDLTPPSRLGVAAPAGSGSVESDTLLQATVAVDATVEFRNRFASLPAAQTYILNLMAQVSTIYENEINVQIIVPYLRVFESEPDPYTNGSTNTSQLLADLRAEWNANQTIVQRTAVHLFSYRSNGGSGIAYLDVLCDNTSQPGNSYDYGVTTLPAGGASWEREMVAHELGHNFSSPHTHCYVPEIDQCANQTGCYQGPIVQTVGTIMSYCNTKSPVFGPRVIDRIRPAAENAYPVCLSIAGGPGAVRAEQGQGLRLSKAGGGNVLLTWGPPCNSAEVPLQDFGVYRGTLGNFTSYTSLTCTTAGMNSYTAAGSAGNNFYLVVPATATNEGSYGRTNTGAERPPAAAPCKAQSLGECPGSPGGPDP